MFRMLKLQPPHGWLAVSWELVIVTVGVLIALGAGQIVEDVDWKQKAAISQRSISQELAEDAGVLDERTMQAPCLEGSLHDLKQIVHSARRSGRIGDVEAITPPAFRPLATTAWDSAVTDGTATHLSGAWHERMGVIYPQLAEYRRGIDQEHRLWARARLVEGAPGDISQPMLAEIAGASAELQYASWLNSILAEQLLGTIRSLGIKPDYSFILDRAGTRQQVRDELQCDRITIDGKPLIKNG